MQKIPLFAALLMFIATVNNVNGQSTIDNKDWKTFLGGNINDTITFHIRSDSSYVTDSRGDVKVRVHCSFSADTLTVVDYGTEEMNCSGREGKYKINITVNSFSLRLISDDCDRRSQALDGTKWTEVQRNRN